MATCVTPPCSIADPGAGNGAVPIAADLGPSTAGLLTETRIATRQGWSRAVSLVPGDLVLTFDHGLQPIVATCYHLIEPGARPPAEDGWPLLVAKGALGNAAPLTLLPGQPILVESDLAEDIFGDPFIAIEARHLAGQEGVSRLRPRDRFAAVTLHFDSDQAVFGAGGVMIVCAGRADLLQARGARPYPVIAADVADRILSDGVLPAGATA